MGAAALLCGFYEHCSNQHRALLASPCTLLLGLCCPINAPQPSRTATTSWSCTRATTRSCWWRWRGWWGGWRSARARSAHWAPEPSQLPGKQAGAGGFGRFGCSEALCIHLHLWGVQDCTRAPSCASLSSNTLPDSVYRLLHSLPAMVDAAWELHTRLLALTPSHDGSGAASAPSAATAGAAAGSAVTAGGRGGGGGDENRLPTSMANMAAVASQRQRLHGLQRAFLEKATAYLQQEFSAVADGPLQRLAAAGGSGSLRLRPADHGQLRRRAAELAPLLEVVGVLRPAAAVAPREAYCQAVNSLLRREAHQAAAEVRRMAAAADAGGGHEPDLLDRAAAADSAG